MTQCITDTPAAVQIWTDKWDKVIILIFNALHVIIKPQKPKNNLNPLKSQAYYILRLIIQ